VIARTIADDFHATVTDDESLAAFMDRNGIHVNTEAFSLVYRHRDGRMEALCTITPDNPGSAAAYVISE
jgi:hypothetical protein